jgi:hypothetical protein
VENQTTLRERFSEREIPGVAHSARLPSLFPFFPSFTGRHCTEYKARRVSDIMSRTTSSLKKRQRTDNQVSTLAGVAGLKGHGDGEGAVAQFIHPWGVAVDGDGKIFVAVKNNHRIRKITPQGHVSTLAGTGVKGHRGGAGTVAQFNEPCGIAVDGDGNVIVADHNHRIRKITPQGHVSTLAGTGVKGRQDGEGTVVAQFNTPCGVAVDGDGTFLWLITTTIIFARSHHRAMCPLWRALAARAIKTEKGTLRSSTSPLSRSGWGRERLRG